MFPSRFSHHGVNISASNSKRYFLKSTENLKNPNSENFRKSILVIFRPDMASKVEFCDFDHQKRCVGYVRALPGHQYAQKAAQQLKMAPFLTYVQGQNSIKPAKILFFRLKGGKTIEGLYYSVWLLILLFSILGGVKTLVLMALRYIEVKFCHL